MADSKKPLALQCRILGVRRMARKVAKLSPAKVTALVKAAKPGLYGDGAGLALRIGPKGATAWALRYMRQGAAREMGLGPVHTIGLAEARERARRHRHTLVPFGTNRCVVEATV